MEWVFRATDGLGNRKEAIACELRQLGGDGGGEKNQCLSEG